MPLSLSTLAARAAQFVAELLLSSLAEATIAAQVREWRTRNAVRSAIEAAFTSTLTTYPNFQETATDIAYLSREGVKIQLAKIAHPTDGPDLEVLEEEWRKHFPVIVQGDVRLVLSRLILEIKQNLREVAGVAPILHRKETVLHQKESAAFHAFAADKLTGIESVATRILDEVSKEGGDETSRQLDAQIDVCEQLRRRGRTLAARDELHRLDDQARKQGASRKALFRIATNLANCALELGDEEEAIRQITTAHDLAPDSPQAKANLAFARLVQGRIKEALELADQVLATNAPGTIAAAVRVQALAHIKGYENVTELVEEQFLDDARYVAALGFIFARAQEHDGAIRYLRQAIALNANDVDSRLLLATIIFDKHSDSSLRIVFEPSARRAKLPESIAENISNALDEALTIARAGDNPRRIHQVLAARSGLKAMSGDLIGAKADADAVLREDERNVIALRNRMLIAIEEHEFDTAVQYFEKLPAEEKADAATALPAAGAYLEARKPDIALELASSICQDEGKFTTQCAIVMAQALFMLSRYDDALAIRNKLLERSRSDLPALEVAAFIDQLVDNVEGMIQNLRSAATLATGEHRQSILLRLAHWHLAQQHFNEAVGYFEQAGNLEEFTPDHLRAYTTALYQAHQYAKAYAAAQSLRMAGMADPTMISIEAWIAEHIGELATAAELHSLLMKLQPQHLKHSINKARVMFRLGKKTETQAILDNIDAPQLSDAIDLMQIAELYAFLNAPIQALQLAYRALRTGYNIPDIHLAYATLFLRCEEVINNNRPGAVEADTAVLISSGTETRWITILRSGQADASHGEFSPDSEQARKLLGLRVGDRALFKATIEELTYEVREIQSIYVRAFQKVLDEFGTLFPSHPGLHRIRIVNRDFTKFFTIVAGHSEFAQKLYELYHDASITLEQLGWLLGRSQIDVQQSLAGLADHRILVSVGSEQDQASQRAAVTAAKSLTIGMSSLVTLGLLDVLGAIEERFEQVYVPQQVIDELDRVITERELSAKKGGRTIGYDNGRYFLEEVPPDRVREGIDKIVSIRDLARKRYIVTGIKPEYADTLRSAEQEIHTVGFVSLATILVAKQTGTPLCVDDQRLRSYAISKFGVDGFWSQPLLENLHDNNLISDTRLYESVAELTSANYYYTAISGEILEWAVEKYKYSLNRQLTRLLEALAGPATDEDVAVLIAGQVLRKIWLAPILLDQKHILLLSLLRILSRGRIPVLVSKKLNNVLQKQFALLPIHLQQIQIGIENWRRIVAPTVTRPIFRKLI